jgi:2,3,4,5-tetrahydropyridine-2-carboxylate N-succinyltransferase
MNSLQKIIESAWDNRELLQDSGTTSAIREVIQLLDLGELRVAEPTNQGWQVNEWVKKAVVLYFPIQQMETIEVGIFEYHDKIPLKRGYAEKGIRVVPHAVARHGAYIAKGVILMPSYVNIGAYVDEGTMGRYLGNGWKLRSNWQKCTFIWRRWYWWRFRTTSSSTSYY